MKRTKRIQRMKRKSLLLAAGILLLLTVAIGGTIAYIVANTEPVVNTFEPGAVPIEIHEDFDGATKSNVGVTNLGNVPAYIRVKLVFTWKDAVGNVSATPVTEKDYDLKLARGWYINYGDGFYYCGSSIEPNATTPALIASCTQKETANVPEGYYLSVEIIAESIQADGMRADDAIEAFAKAQNG